MPRPGVRVELLNALLVLALPSSLPGARARHGRAQEHVDHQHEQEEHPEDDAEVEQPGRAGSEGTSAAGGAHRGGKAAGGV